MPIDTTKALDFDVDDKATRRLLAQALRDLKRGGEGPLRVYAFRMVQRYARFIRARYRLASRGDGTWPPLALSTKISRLRKLLAAASKQSRLARLVRSTGETGRGRQLAAIASGYQLPILRDTDRLYGSTEIGTPENVLRITRTGFEYGTAVPYGRFHQDPPIPGRPPQREIFVDPDAETADGMASDMADGVARVMDAADEA